MKKRILICFGKLLCYVGSIVGRGSTLPGSILLKLDKNMLSQFTLPDMVIAVTGSSGKGSITKVITKTLRNQGYTVAHNEKGSNLDAGILTLLLENTTLSGKIKADMLVCEVDERYTKYVFPSIHPNYVVITNITRDQPPRQGHFDKVFTEIQKAITDDMHLILNADDPYLQKFATRKNKITYYGISKNKYAYTKNKFENLNVSHCPTCHKKLKYHYYQFEALGDYYCECGKLKRPKPDYEITSIQFEQEKMTINKKYHILLKPAYLYQAYNSLACFSVLSLLGLNPVGIANEMSEQSKENDNKNHYLLGKRNVHVLNNKNENSTTFNQSLLYTTRKKELKTIVIGWKEISRRYNFDDLSWLYDIDFELLTQSNVDKIICVGIHRYDIATRMKYAGIDEKKIAVFENLNEATIYLKKRSKGDIFAILNFDYVKPFNELLKGRE